MNDKLLAMMKLNNPNAFTPEGINQAANLDLSTGVPVTGVSAPKIQAPTKDEILLDAMRLKSYKNQEQGLKDYENLLSRQPAASIGNPMVAIASGLSDIFAGTNHAKRLSDEQEAIQKQNLSGSEKLQVMKKDLAKEELSAYENKVKEKKDEKKFDQQMKLLERRFELKGLEPVKTPALKDAEVQSGTYGKRIEQAEEVFSDLEKGGYNRADLGEGLKSSITSIYGLDNLASTNLKRQRQAEQNFLTATLRKESGAAISTGEFKVGEQQYFPRAGDPPEVLAQKKANRQQVLEGMRVGAGPAWNLMKSVPGTPQGMNDKEQMPVDPETSKKLSRLEELRKKAGK